MNNKLFDLYELLEKEQKNALLHKVEPPRYQNMTMKVKFLEGGYIATYKEKA